MKFECNYIIGLTDVAKSNKITNKAILKIMENAGGMHSETVNYGLNSIEKTSLSWILLAWKVKVIKRPIYNTEITINTWARNSNKAFTYRDFEIYNKEGELLIIATSKWALLDLKRGKISELTGDIISPYQSEEISVFEEKTVDKLREPKTVQSKITYKVLRSDIDINNHVHNLYYLDFAYEALPEEIYRNEELNNIEIMYKKEIKLGEQILCLYTREENQNIITIKSMNENVLHAIIKIY